MVQFLFPINFDNNIFQYNYNNNKSYLSYYTYNNQFCNIRYSFKSIDENLDIIVDLEFDLGILEISGNLIGKVKNIPLNLIENENQFKYPIDIEYTCGQNEILDNLAKQNFYFEKKVCFDNSLLYVYSEPNNLAFYFFENIDQNGALSPDPNDTDTVLNIPYQNNWNGQRYLLSTFDETSNTYTPLKLQNIKNISFTIDLSDSTFNSSDNCNFNCYLVGSTSSSSPNSLQPPINNTTYVSSPNYYDSAAADGGRYGVEFDIFEANSGNNENNINFYQHTGHFYTPLLNGTANQSGPSEITFSSDIAFNTEPVDTGAGAPNSNFRTIFNSDNKIIDVSVDFSNPSSTDETTISYNNTTVWNSKWIVGGTWEEWPTATQPEPKEDNPYPCSTVGTLIPFQEIVSTNNNSDLNLKTINDANIAGYWLFIGMNPFYAPPTNSYQGNHSGSESSNGSGGNIKIKNFSYTTW